jgi:transcriptional regulator with XRE-family HTH domain
MVYIGHMANSESVNSQSEPEEWSAQKFKELINTAIELGVKTCQLAIELEVSESTISLWHSGESAPVELVRKTYVEELLDILGERFAKKITHYLVYSHTAVQIEAEIQVFRDTIAGWALGEKLPPPSDQKKILDSIVRLSTK